MRPAAPRLQTNTAMTTPPVSLTADNLAFVEELYAEFARDPTSVPEDFRRFFEAESPGHGAPRLGPSFVSRSLFNPAGAEVNGAAPANASRAVLAGPTTAPAMSSSPERLAAGLLHPPFGSLRPQSGVTQMAVRQDRVDQLIRAYRVRGHMIAKIDPLGLPRPHHQELEPTFYSLGESDLDRMFSSRTIYGTESLSLRQILERLRNTYCRSIGVEFMHIHDPEAKTWLQDRMEGSENRIQLDVERQRHILTLLTDAEMLEEFIQKKFVRAKSFSLEGSESLIPLLHLAIDRAAEHGVDEVTLGMAHRGRLNVLANLMGKSPRQIFREFEDVDPQLFRGRGDVKYHLGFSSDFKTLSGQSVHLSLCFNPSHLEFVNGVVLGRVRAKQDRSGDVERRRKMGLLIHGDAAFIGEGIVQECLNLSGLESYKTGGTVHVVVNNQIGFTTSPHESRSTTYCTDIAKMLQIPIFHVNGEDPEAVAQVVNLAMDFRARFQRDVIIDMYAYRKHGHNEGDEPSFTQPVLYRAVAERPSVRTEYLANMIKMGGVTEQEADQIAIRRRESLEAELNVARGEKFERREDWLGGYWEGYRGGSEANAEVIETSVDTKRLSGLLERQTQLPDSFHPFPKIRTLLKRRAEMARGERRLDWGTAEAAAFASLLVQGVAVRMTGQDVGRGTFAQRHAVLFDNRDGRPYMPLAKLSDEQACIGIHNSPLSEAGVLSFEWGYSLDYPEQLVIWEAQFGDFCNAAQVIIDQFLVSAEDKWKRLSGLVLLLPHGFEGQGPEHSSARLERFLMLSAEDNIQVAQVTTPAQYFHLLRRQVLRRWRKPLVVFTPKSLLRHPQATNTIEEVAQARFQPVLADATAGADASRVLLCSGKIYYELAKHRLEHGHSDVAIVRLEQLYPFPKLALSEALAPFSPSTKVIWVQEEPENMGAWPFLRLHFGDRLLGRYGLTGTTREESASPATGSASSHRLEQQELIERAFSE